MLSLDKIVNQKNRLVHALVIAVGFALMACDGDAPEPGLSLKLREIDPIEASLVNTSNEFALDLITAAGNSDTKSNIFISPFNMTMGLGMLLNGTEGVASEEIVNSIGLEGLDATDLNKAFSEITSLLKVIDDRVTISMANALWTDLDLKIREEYKSRVMAYYDADVRELDLSKDLSKSTINRWVAMKTHGAMPPLFKEMPTNSRIILANAIQFKGSWSNGFDHSDTKSGSFELSERQAVKTSMMYSAGMPGMLQKEKNFTFMEMNYGKGQYCFSVLLPEKGYPLTKLLDNFDAGNYRYLIGNADSVYLNLKMPKFKISYDRSMIALLQGQGVRKVFSSRSGLESLFDGSNSASISEIRHMAAFEASEQGSFSTLGPSGTALSASGATDIALDRPFLFFIRERHTKAILFAGILRDPQAQ